MSARRGSVVLYFLNFSLIAFISGWMRCIFRADFIIWMRVGNMARLMTRVRTRMAQPQLETICSWTQRRARNKGLAMMPE